MIPDLRRSFNESFSENSWQLFLERLNRRFGVPITFRVNPTPLFVPADLQRTCEEASVEFTLRLHTPEYIAASDRGLHPEVTVAGQPEHASFMSVDFALTRAEDGSIIPKLIELQGFPSLMGYQLLFTEMLHEHYGLPTSLTPVNGGNSRTEFLALLRDTIVSDASIDEVVLMDLDPWKQKTCPDFAAVHELLGIPVVDIRSVQKEGRDLFYVKESGRRKRIRRIFNRTIVDEIVRKNVPMPFRWNDELDVEWAGHPNWFFRISKFSLPYLDHPLVPPTRFLSDYDEWPESSDELVLKPLFSFAGTGVIVGPTHEELDAIPEVERSEYILQERVEFAEVIDTPFGGVRAELRIMLVWPPGAPHPHPVMSLVRTGIGEKMGVDANLVDDRTVWIGASCALFEG
jgi:hypothetical protein